MTYHEALKALNDAAYLALRAARNEDGAAVDALKDIATDTDFLINHGCTYSEFKRQKAPFQGAKSAGLL